MRIVKDAADKVPPPAALVWLDDNNDTWFSMRSKSVTIGGREYPIPGGTMRFERDDADLATLVRVILQQRDLWRANNEKGLIEYSEALTKK
ncbi:hypothetical protein [Bradyrhizobium mercantei]|uniref:hypothetical protein n=1 Tax=Bradyrhizobium mercantei TaxID=1904807 RepID=UPI0011787998|nr:hypothetical protein [Bradyrhizobium mercantei]